MADFNKRANTSSTATAQQNTKIQSDDELEQYLQKTAGDYEQPAQEKNSEKGKAPTQAAPAPTQSAPQSAKAPKAAAQPAAEPVTTQPQAVFPLEVVALDANNPKYPKRVLPIFESIIQNARSILSNPLVNMLIGGKLMNELHEWAAIEKAPELFCIGNYKLLLNDLNTIAMVSSQGSSNKSLESMQAVFHARKTSAKAGYTPTIILPNTDDVNFSQRNQDGSVRLGAIQLALDAGCNVVLILGTAMKTDIITRLAKPIQEGRLLVVSLIDPNLMDQNGSLIKSAIRYALVAALSSFAVIIECTGKGGVWAMAIQFVELRQRIFAMKMAPTKQKPLTNLELINDHNVEIISSLEQVMF